MRGGPVNRPALCGLALLSALALAACDASAPDGGGAAPGADQPDGTVGSISVRLDVAGVIHLNQVAYAIDGASVHRSGTLDVSKSGILGGVIGGIPIGSGYTLRLTSADATNPMITCQGSSPFDVPGATTVSVMVHVLCKEPPKDLTPPPPSAAVPLSPAAMAALALLLLGLGRVVLGRVGAPRRPEAR